MPKVVACDIEHLCETNPKDVAFFRWRKGLKNNS